MKKFLLKILLFTAPVFLLAYPLDYFISNNLAKSHYYDDDEFLVWNDIYKGKINADLLVYGSSRAWVHFDPQLLEDSLHIPAYNVGINGLTFWFQYLRHKQLLKYNKKPSVILLSLDVFSLQKGTDLFNYQQFLPYMLYDKEIREYTASVKGFNFWDYYFPLVRYYGEKNSLQHAWYCLIGRNNEPPTRVKGYQGQPFKWNDDFEKAKTGMKKYEIITDPGSAALFEQFIRECKAGGIQLIFVYSPEYVSGQEFVSNRDEIIRSFHDYANKYSILFFDYSKDPICTERKYFYNTQHLNKEGAELFTRKLISDLKRTNALQLPKTSGTGQ